MRAQQLGGLLDVEPTLMQLRFASFAVINLRRDLHPRECAHSERTKKSVPVLINRDAISEGDVNGQHRRL